MRLIPYLAILLPFNLLAQVKTPMPTFGKVDKSEVLLKNCEFDKNAGALVLYESAKLYFDISNGVPYAELQHFVRIKILTDKGLDEANIKLRYRSKSNDENITNLTANTYN